MKKELTVLITGATGLLGTHLLLSKPKSVRVIATIHQFKKIIPVADVETVSLDIRDKKQVNDVIKKYLPDVIIHTAAHTNVDYCEQHSEDTKMTNISAVRHLVASAKKYKAKIFFCSTNITFDGKRPPYTERSRQHPETLYGRTKVMGEKIIKNSGVTYCIFRLMTMYGWNWQPKRLNMIAMAVGKLRDKKELWMTNDIWNNLLYVNDAAQIFWKAVLHPDKSKNQTFHIAGKDRVNRFQATQKVCEIFGFDSQLVHEVTSAYFDGNETPRSPDTCFVTTKVEKQLGYKPRKLQSGLKHLVTHPLPI